MEKISVNIYVSKENAIKNNSVDYGDECLNLTKEFIGSLTDDQKVYLKENIESTFNVKEPELSSLIESIDERLNDYKNFSSIQTCSSELIKTKSVLNKFSENFQNKIRNEIDNENNKIFEKELKHLEKYVYNASRSYSREESYRMLKSFLKKFKPKSELYERFCSIQEKYHNEIEKEKQEEKEKKEEEEKRRNATKEKQKKQEDNFKKVLANVLDNDELMQQYEDKFLSTKDLDDLFDTWVTDRLAEIIGEIEFISADSVRMNTRKNVPVGQYGKYKKIKEELKNFCNINGIEMSVEMFGEDEEGLYGNNEIALFATSFRCTHPTKTNMDSRVYFFNLSNSEKYLSEIIEENNDNDDDDDDEY